MGIEKRLETINVGDVVEGICEECRQKYGTEKHKLKLIIKGKGEINIEKKYYVFNCENGHKVQQAEAIPEYDISQFDKQYLESLRT